MEIWTDLIYVFHGFIGLLLFPILAVLIFLNYNPKKTFDFLSHKDSISKSLASFKTIRNDILRRLIQSLDLTLAFGSIFLILLLQFEIDIKGDNYALPLIGGSVPTIFVISLLGTCAIGFFFSKQLLFDIPTTLYTIWNHNILGVRDPGDSIDTKLCKWDQESIESENSTDLEKQFLAYIHSFEAWLNNPIQWILGFIIAYVFAYRGFLVDEFLNKWYSGSNPLQLSYVEYFYECIGLIIIFLSLGIIFWKMIIIGIYISKIGSDFPLNPQFGHPDGCGGLSSIGNICLKNVLILSIAGFFMGFFVKAKIFYIDNTLQPISILILLSIFCFFVPMISIHRVMITKKSESYSQLNNLSNTIDLVEQEILNKSKNLELDEVDKAYKKMNLLRQVYLDNKNFPTWPYNVDIMKKFLLYQALPILGFILPELHLSGPTRELINSSIAFFVHT